MDQRTEWSAPDMEADERMAKSYTPAGVTFGEVYKNGCVYLEEAGIDNAAGDAWTLFEMTMHMTRAQYFLRCRDALGEDMEGPRLRFGKLLARRAVHVPLQYLTNVQNFMGFDFYVDEAVLIPRQDTECLVELVLREQEEREKLRAACENIQAGIALKQPDCESMYDNPVSGNSGVKQFGELLLDMCTGSGCILLSLMKLGQFRKGVGVDISLQALAVAKRNREALELSEQKVSLIQGDMFQALDSAVYTSKEDCINNDTAEKKMSVPDCVTGIPQMYDVIVSNPPYITAEELETLSPEVINHEPRIALYGPEDGLYFYRCLAAEGKRYLKPGGRIYMEIGCNQGRDVMNILQNEGFVNVKLQRDLAGLDRIVYATKV